MSTPSATVFHIPELLEKILLNLDPRTLLTAAQSTCKTWTSLITTSSRIQQALFLAPAQHPEKVLNPLLAVSFPSLFPTSLPDDDVDDGPSPSPVPLTFTSCDIFSSPDRKKAYMRPEASWRRMLLHQPPVFEMGFVKIRTGMRSQSFQVFQIQPTTKDPRNRNDRDVLRMRHLFEWLIFSPTITYTRSSIRMLWRGYTQAEAHIPRRGRHSDLPAAYEGLFRRSELVLDEMFTVSCKRGGPRVLSENETLRDELCTLYEGVTREELSFEETDITERLRDCGDVLLEVG